MTTFLPKAAAPVADSELSSFEDGYRSNHARPTIAEIREAVSEAFAVPVKLIRSGKRIQPAARARQVVMLLAHEMTGRSVSSIARACERDHSTALYAIATIRRLSAEDCELARQIDQARDLIPSVMATRPPVHGAVA